MLASAGPTYIYFGFVFDGKDVTAGTMLGEHLAEADFTSSSDPDVKPEGDFDGDGDLETGDIIVFVNENIDYDNGCLGGAGYYYGQDSDNGDQINFSNVLLHELGHGIGFASFTNRNSASPDFGEFVRRRPGRLRPVHSRQLDRQALRRDDQGGASRTPSSTDRTWSGTAPM